MRRGVVIGLDGAAWHLLEPLMAGGVMPRLAALKQQGASGTLVSTVPTYTPPAWTSAATGVNPGRHGIFGFIEGHAQSQEHKLVHSGKIRAATIWEIVNSQGGRAGVYNLPLTYPPVALEGWMVSGMMTPGYGERLRGFASPSDLEARILEWAPGYVVDVSANYEKDWRDASLCDVALGSINQRYTVLENLLEADPPDVLFSVMEAPDRLQHVYYRYMDPADELHEGAAGAEIRPRIEECFAALDRIVGLLVDFAGADGGVVVCSDHGFTAWEVSVHINALLESWGYLTVKPTARVMQTAAARKAVPVAKRILPRKLARDAKAKTFAAIDWSKTRAFASPIPQQGIFINLEGREEFGIVAPSELDGLKSEIAARFAELRGPDGGPVTDRVWRSEEVFVGDALDGAPDLLPVLRDHRYELDDEVFHRDPFTDVSELPRGVHHPDGIVVVAGPGVRRAASCNGSILDVSPTLLYMAGLKVPEGLDGTVITDAFDEDHLKEQPVQTTPRLSSGARDEASPYSEEEEAIIEESLRGLGYL